MVEKPSLLVVWRRTPATFKGGSTKFGFMTEEYSGTPMARWAGEGNDCIELMAQRKPRKDDVIRSLLESIKQAVEKKADPNGTIPI